MNDDIVDRDLLAALLPDVYSDGKGEVQVCNKAEPVRGENINFSLQAPPSTEQARANKQPAYLTADEYTRIKVKHWKEEYILPEIDNPVAVGLYALFRAYQKEKGNIPLKLQTRYVYRRSDTGEMISAEERKQLGNMRAERIAYGLRELYRRSGGGTSSYQLHEALEQLTAQGYLTHDGAGGYIVSDKRPERLYNADEFLSFATEAGIAVILVGYGCIRLDGTNEGAKNTLQNMLDYSHTSGRNLEYCIIRRIKGWGVFYDWE